MPYTLPNARTEGKRRHISVREFSTLDSQITLSASIVESEAHHRRHDYKFVSMFERLLRSPTSTAPVKPPANNGRNNYRSCRQTRGRLSTQFPIR